MSVEMIPAEPQRAVPAIRMTLAAMQVNRAAAYMGDIRRLHLGRMWRPDDPHSHGRHERRWPDE